METSNAFVGKTTQPTDAELTEALGPAAPLWTDFVGWMASRHGFDHQEWKGVYVNKYGWSLRLMQKKKIVVYLAPCEGCFRVAFNLNGRAYEAAKSTHFPKPVAEVIATAPHYPEGTGVRLTVHRAQDLGPVRKLAEIKLAN